MINKKNVRCIKKTYVGPFWDSFLVQIVIDNNVSDVYNLRIMKKPSIIKYEEEKLIQYEYYIRTSLRHVFMINILYSFQDYDNLFLITESANTNLIEFLKMKVSFDKDVAIFYIVEIIIGINYLHTKGLTYGFLSPGNIKIHDNGHIKLKYDFLNAIEPKMDGIKDYIEYTSPEFITKRIVTHKSDFWGVGIILFYMMAGYTPFYSDTYEKTVYQMANSSVSFPAHMDEDSKDLIKRLLNKNPNERIKYDEIRRHSFFRDIDWKNYESRKIEPPFLFNRNDKYRRYNLAKLEKLYTTDYYQNQKDGYGYIFKYFGTSDVTNPYL